jgi:uncharacterized surface protein with fasciclin (FAS1) repeats
VTLLKPESKAVRTKVLTYHVVSGRLSVDELKKQIKKGGTATLKTVSGGMLWAMMDSKDIVLKDEKGEVSRITQANAFQSNGVIHVIDSVVLPNLTSASSRGRRMAVGALFLSSRSGATRYPATSPTSSHHEL